MAPQGHQQSQPMTKRAIISAFIFRFPPNQPTKPSIALFKRSNTVRTYRHHLAPISGSIDLTTDPTPLAAAWRELREETTLTPSDLSLWRTGKPFTFCDPSITREWTVHPFAFRLKSPTGEGAIRTDWEHEGWEWYDPKTVLEHEKLNLPTVPRLQDSLARVWFEGVTNERAGRALATGLERLATDHESGSHELTAIALTVFRDFIVYSRGDLDGRWWDMVRAAGWHLVKNGRESMGAGTLNAVLSILGEIEGILEQGMTGAEGKWERILAVVDHYLGRRVYRAQQIKDCFVSYLLSQFADGGGKKDRLTILTMSSSSTIRDSILDAYDSLRIKSLELRILESRPLFEGASIASSILSTFKSRPNAHDKHLHIRLYTDASAALAAKDVDIVLLGADCISATKGVSNKTGSLPLVLSARHVTPSVRVVVLSALEKVTGSTGVIDDELTESNDPFEVWSAWRSDGVRGVQVLEKGMKRDKSEEETSSVTVENTYFEWVPLDMVDAFVCEEGVLDRDSIQEKSRKLKEMADRYFGNL